MDDGFDELINDLERMEDELDGTEVPFSEIFSPPFMRKYTDAKNIDEFFANSPWQPSAEEEFDAIPTSELDHYVDDHSRFRTWEQMQSKAGNEWLGEQLDL